MTSNNITRMLDNKNISYTAFDLPEEKLGAVEAASILNVPVDVVYKTIVILREKHGKPILAIVSGANEVDLKKLAAVVGEKKLRLPTVKEAEQLTGLQVGGISPLALLNRGYQLILDENALLIEQIYISGGQRGLNLRLHVKDLIDLTHARLAAICK